CLALKTLTVARTTIYLYLKTPVQQYNHTHTNPHLHRTTQSQSDSGPTYPLLSVRGSVPPCDEGWYLFEDSCYYFSNTLTSWNQARKACQRMKADLVIISSEDVQNFILRLQPYGESSSASSWIGLTDGQREGYWTWVDGSPLISYTNWRRGEPNNMANEDCVEIEFYFRGSWNDNRCSRSRSFICQK
ncbi:hypothetical protein BaRGS_00033058, partial [Batillaria attramentaria]